MQVLSIFLSQLINTGFHSGFKWVTMYGVDDRKRGYVELPHDHPWVLKRPQVSVPGGITFVEGDWVGFDCEANEAEMQKLCIMVCVTANEIY